MAEPSHRSRPTRTLQQDRVANFYGLSRTERPLISKPISPALRRNTRWYLLVALVLALSLVAAVLVGAGQDSAGDQKVERFSTVRLGDARFQVLSPTLIRTTSLPPPLSEMKTTLLRAGGSRHCSTSTASSEGSSLGRAAGTGLTFDRPNGP